MAKANDKKVVRHARDLLLATIGNLLESHRERRFRDGKQPQSRAAFCAEKGLVVSTVGNSSPFPVGVVGGTGRGAAIRWVACGGA
jgi:hypothetical protein